MQATASATAATQAIQQDPALSSEAVQSGQDMFACLVLASGSAHFQEQHKASADFPYHCPVCLLQLILRLLGRHWPV